MPRYRFSWDRFDDATVTALAHGYGYPSDTPQTPREWLAMQVKRPDDRFVRVTKTIIEDQWLSTHLHAAQSIVEVLLVAGIGPRVRPTTAEGCVDYIRRCRNSDTVRRLLRDLLIQFGDTDRVQSDEEAGLPSPVPAFNPIRPREQKPDGFVPRAYQKQVWEVLNEHYAAAQSSGDFRGLVVMPTGSGKTVTLVRWAIPAHLNRGGRVLWIAHQHHLLAQAAKAFYEAAGLAISPEMRVRVVSGVHCSITTVGPEDHVVIMSSQSASKRMDKVDEYLSGDDVLLVVDEAHHSAASTYRKLFNILERRRTKYAVGLTATPTRTLADERPVLARLFGGRKFVEIPIRELVERQFLARPHPEIVHTDVTADEGVTANDIAHLEKFQELTPAWQDRLANMVRRNEAVVTRYQHHAERYGKTLVFAINVAHAQLLRDRFREAGIEAEYIASYRLDDDDVDYAEVLERFQRPASGLNVLINVQILTEGVDLPCVQTVFLTRPTRSEILLRQMIGRALRGPQVEGGTERAYLVSFEDHWSRFVDWEHPFELVNDIMECAPAEAAPPEIPPIPKPLADAVPWDLVKATADELRRLGGAVKLSVFEAVPHGWYVLEREDDVADIREVVHVYQHQNACWEALLNHLWQGPRSSTKPSAEELYAEFFADCDSPQPSSFHVGQVLQHFLADGERPEFIAFTDRRTTDPYAIAREILERDLGQTAQDALLQARYELPLARAIYPTLWEFTDDVNKAKFELKHPDQRRCPPKVEVVFGTLPDIKLAAGPAHDLDSLMAAVLEQARQILNEHVSHTGELRWTNRPVRNYYAYARWNRIDPPCKGEILVNCVLDSPDISAATVKFLLWHELLHLYLQDGHTKRFRELERMWPGYRDADRELDTLHERFAAFY